MALAAILNIARTELCLYSASYFSCENSVLICIRRRFLSFLVLSLPLLIGNWPDITTRPEVSIFSLTLALTFILIQNAGLQNYGQSALG